MKLTAARMKTFACAAALSALSAFGAARPDATITFDTSAPAFKDQRESRANPVMGWAGTITDIGGEVGKYLFETDPDRTWKVLEAAGCHFVKMWQANDAWELSTAYAALKTDEERKAFVKRNPRTVTGDPAAIVIPAYTMATLVFPIEKGAHL